MSVDLSKVTYGAIVGPGEGITINKITFGIIIDTLTPEPSGSDRRRQVMVGSF